MSEGQQEQTAKAQRYNQRARMPALLAGVSALAIVSFSTPVAAQSVLFGRELKKEEQTTPSPSPTPTPRPGPTPSPTPTPSAADDGLTTQQRQLFSKIEQSERQDFGVAATRQLNNGPSHAPTPTQLPGGRVVTTRALYQMLRSGQPVITAEVLGGPQLIEGTSGTYSVPAYGQGGSFNDYVQQDLASGLSQVTGGNATVPIVFYCQGTYCWLSYNAALRAIAAGHRNVMWYRGGIEAWQMANLPFIANQPY